MSYFFGRRRYLSQPRRQASLAAKMIVLLVLYGGLVAFLILFPITQTLDVLPANGLTPETRASIASLPPYFWPVIVVLACLAAVQVILQSHRVFGPSIRLQRVIREMAAGKCGLAVSIRKGDYLHELAISVAALDDSLCRRRQACLEQIRALQMRIQPHAGGGGSPQIPPLGQAEIKEILQQITSLAHMVEGTAPENAPGVRSATTSAGTGAEPPTPTHLCECHRSLDNNPAASA